MAAEDAPVAVETTVVDGIVPECKGTPGNKIRILSIDGGGVRGIIPAVCLEYLESQLQVLDGREARIVDYFDVVAGTSTGGLIAAMLTAPKNKRPMFTAEEVKQFYLDNASKIFSKKTSIDSTAAVEDGGVDSTAAGESRGLVYGKGPTYGSGNLANLLDKHLKDLKVADALTDVFITTFDVKTLQPVFFNRHLAESVPRFNAFLRDVCLATSAAPTYFPPQQFEVPDGESDAGKSYQYNLTDGGVAVNNPAEVAILHAVKDTTIGRSPYNSRGKFKGYEDMLLLSLGTGELFNSGYDAKSMERWGSVDWVIGPGLSATRRGSKPLVEMFLNSSAYLVDYDISIRFQVDGVEENYLRLQTHDITGDMAKIDNASEKNMKDLMDKAYELLDEKAKYRDVVTGELKDKIYNGQPYTNRQGLSWFAEWLSIEKKARENPAVDPAAAIAPETEIGTFV